MIHEWQQTVEIYLTGEESVREVATGMGSWSNVLSSHWAVGAPVEWPGTVTGSC